MKFLARLAVALLVCFSLGSVARAQAPASVTPGVTLNVTVEPEDFDGLTVRGPQGELYLVLVPEEISFEELSAFHAKYKNKQIALSGDVLTDGQGNLSFSVRALPK